MKDKELLQHLSKQENIYKLTNPDLYVDTLRVRIFQERKMDERDIRLLAIILRLYVISIQSLENLARDFLTDNAIIHLDNTGAYFGMPMSLSYRIGKTIMEVSERNKWNDTIKAFAQFATGYFDFEMHFRRKVKDGEKHFAKCREYAFYIKRFSKNLRFAFAKMAWYWNQKGKDWRQAEIDADIGLRKAEESNCRYVGWCYRLL